MKHLNKGKKSMQLKTDGQTRTVADNTALAKVTVQCSADTFVVEIANLDKPETVKAPPISPQLI
jgi:hypothetical protein